MAMEVSKQLHHHALLITAVILILIVALTSVIDHEDSALVARPFNIHPTKSGLAKIYARKTIQDNNQWIQAGQEAELSLSLH